MITTAILGSGEARDYGLDVEAAVVYMNF